MIDKLEQVAKEMSEAATENGYGIDNTDECNRKRVKFSKTTKKYSYFLNNFEITRDRM